MKPTSCWSHGPPSFTAGLGLDVVGVATDKLGRVKVDMHTYATSKPGVFGLPTSSRPMLAHKAEEEGISAEQLAGKVGHELRRDPVHHLHASGGGVVRETEEEAKASSQVQRRNVPFRRQPRATNDDSEGLVKFVSCAGTDKILGAHIVGPRGEPASAFWRWSTAGARTSRTCHGHPTPRGGQGGGARDGSPSTSRLVFC